MSTGGRRWRLVRAGTDAVPASVRRFMARARRRPRGDPRARARVLALAGTVIGLVGLLGWILWSSSLLGVREVRVTGTELLSPADVAQEARVAQETPLLRVDLAGVARRVATLPPVERVTVRRDWPDTIVIEVVERTAVAAVPDGDRVVLVDAHAMAFQTAPELPAGLPLVMLSEPGPEDPATRAAITVLAELTPRLREELRSVTVSGPVGIELELHSGRTIVWGDETDSDRKAQVATILLDYDGDLIDVSTPDVVSLR